MEKIQRSDCSRNHKDEEEARASVDIWRYVFGFVDMAVVKCAIQLKIAEAIENHNPRPVTLPELSSAISCSPSFLSRIMRFLVHQGIFGKRPVQHGAGGGGPTEGYTNTPLSRRLIRHGTGAETSMAGFILLEASPVMLAPWHSLSSRVLAIAPGDLEIPPFDAAHGKDVWAFAAGDAGHSELINEAMACDARQVVPAIVEGCEEGEGNGVFEGVGRLVDVGGGNGTALGMLVKAFPWIHGINFDLPHVVDAAPAVHGVEHIGGDMFVSVPKADAAFLMWVLHDWGDEECIEILKKCKEAIPEEKGKVIIVEAVVGEKKEEKLEEVRLMLDMVMMAHTRNGKERTFKEWEYVLKAAGFSRFDVIPIKAVQSVIVAFV